jgi:hypothetical protein
MITTLMPYKLMSIDINTMQPIIHHDVQHWISLHCMSGHELMQIESNSTSLDVKGDFTITFDCDDDFTQFSLRWL